MKKKIIIISKILVLFWILLLGILLVFMYLSNKEEIEVSDPIAIIFMVIAGLTGLLFCIMFILEIISSIKENQKYVILKCIGEFILIIFICMLFDIVVLKSYKRIEVLTFALVTIIFTGVIKYWKRNKKLF